MKNDIYTRLETKRLILNPILESEFDILHSILNNSHVRKYLCDDKTFSLQEVKEMIKRSREYFETESFGLWFMRINTMNEIIGFVGLWYFFGEEQPQVVYALVPKVLKNGYATEAAAKIVEYSFDYLNLKYMEASCDRLNMESQKVALRLGMNKTLEKSINGNPVIFFRIDNQKFSSKNHSATTKNFYTPVSII